MRRAVSFVVWLLLAGSLAGPAFGQGVLTGTLRGAVVDPQGLPVPNVIVTISSAALQGGDRATRTGGDGAYVFRALPPGDYDVSIEMTGFATLLRATTIPLGAEVELNVELRTAGVAEAVEVVAPTPVPAPAVAVNVRQEEVEALATSRSLSGIALLAPGVNDNAPNASSGQVVISGAFAFDNLFMVNGVDVNDNVFGNPQSLFIEDAIAETQVLTSGISAEYGRFSGGVVNAITKSGGNTFGGSYRVNLTNPGWASQTPFEADNGIETESDLNLSQEATFGGPIALDRLWFFAAGRLANVSTAAVFDQTGQPYVQQDRNRRGEIKLTATVAHNHAFQGGYLNNASETTDRPSIGISIDRATLLEETRPNWYTFAGYRGALGESLLAEVRYSTRRFAFEGAGGTDTAITSSPFITITQEPGHYNAPYFDGNDPEERNNQQVTGTLSGLLEAGGRHEIKGGYEFYRSQLTGGGGQSPTSYVFYSDYLTDDQGRPVRDAGGFLIPVFVPFVSEYDNWRAVRGAALDIDTQSLFVQDRWTIDRRLTAGLGLRYEHARSQASGGRRGVNTSTLSPRLALTFDPRADGRFVINTTYGHYSGRYNEAQMSANVNVGQPNVLFAFYAGPPGQGRDFAPGFDPDNYVVYFGRFPTANVFFADGLSSPVTREFTVSAGGLVGSRGFAEVSYVRRDMSDLVEDFIELGNGATTVQEDGVVFGTFTNSVYRNTNLADRRYQALVFQGRYRPARGVTLNGFWTVQLENDGNYEGEASNQPGLVSAIGDFPEAISAERHYPTGRLASFQRHRLRLWSIYDVGLGRAGRVSLSGLLRVESGRVFSLVASGLELSDVQLDRLAEYPDSPVSQTIFFGPRGRGSFRGHGAIDVSVNYSVPVWQALSPWIKFDVFNVLNNDKQIAWTTAVLPDASGPVDALGLPTRYVESPNFGRATSNSHYPAPRDFRLSVGFRF